LLERQPRLQLIRGIGPSPLKDLGFAATTNPDLAEIALFLFFLTYQRDSDRIIEQPFLLQRTNIALDPWGEWY
jgi:hypothetical protein